MAVRLAPFVKPSPADVYLDWLLLNPFLDDEYAARLERNRALFRFYAADMKATSWPWEDAPSVDAFVVNHG